MKRFSIIFIILLVSTGLIPNSQAEIVDKNKTAYVWFSKCVDENDLDCIESLGVVDALGRFSPGFPTGYSRPSLTSGSVEKKTLGFLDYTWNHKNETWELPGLNTEYGNSYVITEFSLVTGVGRWYDPASNSIYPPSGVNSMRFALLAVPTIQGFANSLWGVPLKDFEHKCVDQTYSAEMICQRTANFSSDQKIRATLRFSWYRARQVQSNLRENEYQVEELGNGATRVTVTGKPMERPYFVDSLTLNRNILTREKADAVTNHWEVLTNDAVDGYTPQKCRDKGLPIVTGNMWSQTPPTWDPATGDLKVNVWAPHLDPKGNPYKGYYEGNFSLDYITCLWGIDSKGIADQITVSILNESDSGNNLVTSSISQTKSGVRLIASGFHYSTETIRFHKRESKTSADSTNTPIPQASPTASPIPSPSSTLVPKPTTSSLPKSSKQTIACVKGKLTKKVTGVNPKCPTGYKKK